MYWIMLTAALFVSVAALSVAEAAELIEAAPTAEAAAARGEPAKSALELSFGAKLDLLRNVSGGIASGGRPLAHVEANLAADLDAALGWSGTTSYLSLIYDGGGKINAEQVGSQMGVSNIEVPVSTFRLFQAWLQKEFAGGRGSFLVGLYPIDTEFQVVDSAALFLQPPYGATADLAQSRGPSIFDKSALGMRAKWLSEDRSAYLLGAMLDGLPGDPDNPHGTHIKFGKGDGVMSITELGFKPSQTPVAPELSAPNASQARADEPVSAPLPDSIEKYAAGLWNYSAHVDDLLDHDLQRRSWGWYALAERTLARVRGGGDWAGFIRVSGTDGDSTAIQRAVNIGLRGQGIFAGRSADIFGIGYSRASLSEKFREVQALAGTTAAAFEAAWEITYRIPINKYLAVQPDIQRISHPGGEQSKSAAVIVGSRVEIAY
jgi:porin